MSQMVMRILHLLVCFTVLSLSACVATVPLVPEDREQVQDHETLVVGHVITVLIGPTTRWYNLELRFFELVHLPSEERIRVQVESDDSWFILPLRPGQYEVARILVNEGAFQGAADLGLTFQVTEGQITYLGTWRLGVESPQYERMVLLSAVAESDQVVSNALTSYPLLRDRPMLTELPSPSITETRLYEVPPYPRVWWFRRHFTS